MAPPRELAEALEAVAMLRAGLVSPWTWDEFGELPAPFVEQLLAVIEVVGEVERAKAEEARG